MLPKCENKRAYEAIENLIRTGYNAKVLNLNDLKK